MLFRSRGLKHPEDPSKQKSTEKLQRKIKKNKEQFMMLTNQPKYKTSRVPSMQNYIETKLFTNLKQRLKHNAPMYEKARIKLKTEREKRPQTCAKSRQSRINTKEMAVSQKSKKVRVGTSGNSTRPSTNLTQKRQNRVYSAMGSNQMDKSKVFDLYNALEKIHLLKEPIR